MTKRYVVGMSGASGAPYTFLVIEELLRQGHEVHLTLTEAAWMVLKEEHQWSIHRREQLWQERYADFKGKLVYHPVQDIGASIASGSFQTEAMVVLPCSMGTLARISQGLSTNLLDRAADVMLKERRPLILVPREMPLHVIHLENMLHLVHAGAIMAPAMPAFYLQPKKMDDLVAFVAGKILDLLHVKHQLCPRWEGRGEQ